MQGSSLVDIETHSVWVWRLFFFSTVRRVTKIFRLSSKNSIFFSICPQPQISEWSNLIQDVSVTYLKEFEGNDVTKHTMYPLMIRRVVSEEVSELLPMV